MMEDLPRDHPLVPDNLASLQSHVLAEETLFPNATGDFSWIISAISLAGKTIANKVRRARLDDVLGSHDPLELIATVTPDPAQAFMR